MIPKLVGNQKAIRINRIPLEGNRFTALNYKAQQDAMAALRPNTFKVWVYLCGHKDDYELGLSSKAITKFCNISRGTYDRAVEELIEKGYLTKKENLRTGIDGYEFWEGGALQSGSYQTENF